MKKNKPRLLFLALNKTCVGFFLCSATKKGSTSDALVIMTSPSCSHALCMWPRISLGRRNPEEERVVTPSLYLKEEQININKGSHNETPLAVTLQLKPPKFSLAVDQKLSVRCMIITIKHLSFCNSCYIPLERSHWAVHIDCLDFENGDINP